MLREQTAANPERMKAALEGLRKYQEAPRPDPPEAMPVLAEAHGAALRDYGGSRAPAVFVPSLINPPNVLDMGDRSLLRWLSGRGHRVLLLDWGWPGPGRRAMSVAGHVEQILLPLLGALGEPAILAGYCLGGTMALAAAGPGEARGVATIAAPWRFHGFPEASRAALGQLWQGARPAVDALGLLPMEVLQSAFWSLDPARTVAKFEAFAAMEGEEARTFVMLEDWANDGPPISAAAGREMFEDFLGADTTGTGRWRVAGRAIDPSALPCPILNIVSTTDRIVPAATAHGAGKRVDLNLGHVGMIVGSRARESLWEPLEGWLSRIAASC
jgi:polyhydroxyalkanoate synthase